MILRIRRAVRRADRGSASLELLGLMPVIVLVMCALLYASSVVYTVNAANQAVRDGARAMSLGQSAEAAVHRSLPDSIDVQRISYPAGAVRLEVRSVKMAMFPRVTVTREATMPRTVNS